MRSFFTWAGRSSLEMGLTVESCPSYEAGQRIVNKTQVPGRSGDLVFDTGAFANVTQQYEVWFKAAQAGPVAASKKISSWLLAPFGYQQLEDTYDPEIFRRAVFAGPVEVENWMLKYGRATLEFDCMPQKWLKSGQQPITMSSGMSLYNQWMPTKPLLLVTGNGQLQIGSAILQVSGTTGQFYIDCETENAYQGANNLNANIQAVDNAFPVLAAGATQVSFSGFDALQIIPRWWSV